MIPDVDKQLSQPLFLFKSVLKERVESNLPGRPGGPGGPGGPRSSESAMELNCPKPKKKSRTLKDELLLKQAFNSNRFTFKNYFLQVSYYSF